MPPYVSKYQGQQLTDNAGNYKGECLSLIKWVQQHDLGLPNADNILHAVNGAAKDLWLSPQPIQEQYFDKVSTPQVNDIAVYTNGEFGDVAYYVGSDRVFGQLGTPVFQPAGLRNIGSPAGYLRRKGQDMTVDDAGARALLTLSTLMAQPGIAPDRQPTQQEVQNLIGRDLVDAVNSLTSTSPWGGNWNKVKHYDEDVKNAGGNATVLKPGKYQVN